MKPLLHNVVFWLVILVTASSPSHSQLPILQQVQQARTEAKQYRQEQSWEKAKLAYLKVVANTTYANPFDHLSLAHCSLKAIDSVGFTKHLATAIAEGVDTTQIRSFFRSLTAAENARLQNFMAAHFADLHQQFRNTHDTTLIETINTVQVMDQIGRTPLQSILQKKPFSLKDSNIYYLTAVQRMADSINYFQIMRLLEGGQFPGYRTCGAVAASFGQVLLHFDAAYVNWDYIMLQLKKAVQIGDLDPDQVAGIVDRHYLGLASPSYYYGRLKWGERPFFDCQQVDQFRAEIGIENLQAEYDRGKRALPECYLRARN